MPDRHALALDVGAAHRRRVEQQVDQVVVQQVHLVDVEHAAVRRGQQPGLEGLDPLGQRPLQVQRADDPVLGGADRQLDQPGRPLARPPPAVRPVRALRVGRRRVAGEPAAVHHRDRRQQPRPARAPSSTSRCPSRRGPAPRRSAGETALSSSAEPQVVHPDDGGERVSDVAHKRSPSIARTAGAPGGTKGRPSPAPPSISRHRASVSGVLLDQIAEPVQPGLACGGERGAGRRRRSAARPARATSAQERPAEPVVLQRAVPGGAPHRARPAAVRGSGSAPVDAQPTPWWIS